ncbi:MULTISPECIES: hypothetical protein [unclassified Sphingomonas]|nr:MULTISPECIES: hypothetical protein [unclassified Sphingomonas]
MLKKAMATAVAMSLVSVPAIASAADASKLSLAPSVRAGKVVAEKEKAEGSSGIIIGVVAAAAVIAGIIIIADDDEATSP